MEKYKDSDVELMSILLKLQEQTSPIRTHQDVHRIHSRRHSPSGYHPV